MMNRTPVFLRIALWVALVAMLFPILWMIVTSIKPDAISQSLPPIWIFRPTFGNYDAVLTGKTYTATRRRIFLCC